MKTRGLILLAVVVSLICGTAILESRSVSASGCVDPDGQNYLLRTTSYDDTGYYTDRCSNAYVVTEYYCDAATGALISEDVSCWTTGQSGVCGNGACLPCNKDGICDANEYPSTCFEDCPIDNITIISWESPDVAVISEYDAFMRTWNFILPYNPIDAHTWQHFGWADIDKYNKKDFAIAQVEPRVLSYLYPVDWYGNKTNGAWTWATVQGGLGASDDPIQISMQIDPVNSNEWPFVVYGNYLRFRHNGGWSGTISMGVDAKYPSVAAGFDPVWGTFTYVSYYYKPPSGSSKIYFAKLNSGLNGFNTPVAINNVVTNLKKTFIDYDISYEPHIVYSDATWGLIHAYRDPITQVWSYQTIDSCVDTPFSFIIDKSTDNMEVAYVCGNELRYASLSASANGQPWHTEVITSSAFYDLSYFPSIAVDLYSTPTVTFADGVGGLYMARQFGTSWIITPVTARSSTFGKFDNAIATQPALSYCGNGVCELDKGEHQSTCPQDCFCGDNVCDWAEESDLSSCSDCTAVCGNNRIDQGEQCDGTDSGMCPNQCLPSCTCGAPPLCITQNSACSGAYPIELMRLSSSTNAHAELPSSGTYPYYVCCPSNFGTACSGTEGADYDYVAFLSSVTNAHVEFVNDVTGGDPVTYTYPVCLSETSPNGVVCALETTGQECSVFGTGYGCVVTISSQTNAHAASCTDQAAYSNKICCSVISAPDNTPPIITFIPQTPNNNTISQYPANSGNYVKYIIVNVTANEPLKSCTMRIKGPSFPLGITRTMIPHTTGCWFNESANNMGLREPTYTIYVNASDRAGNVGSTLFTEGNRFIKVAEFPTSTITFPVAGGVYNLSSWAKSRIQGTARDTQTGVAKVDIAIRNASNGRYWMGSGWVVRAAWLSTQLSGGALNPQWQYIGVFSQEGDFNILSNATDLNGFEQRPPLTTVNFKVDYTNPDTMLTVLYNGGTVGSYPTYAGQAQDKIKNGYSSKIVRVEYQVSLWNGAAWVITTPWTSNGMSYPGGLIPNETVDFSVTPTLSQGLNQVEFRGVDGAQNYDTTPATDTVNYDLDYPFLQIISPSPAGSPFNGATWAAANPIRGQANDAQGWVTATQFFIQRVNDSLYFDPATKKWIAAQTWIPAAQKGSAPEVYDPWRYLDLSTYVPDDIGFYRIKANATDDTSHISAIEVTVAYDNENPTATISPLPLWTTTPDITVSWDGSDRMGIASFLVEWNDGAGWQQLLPPTSQAGTATLTSVADATTYTFRVTATDLAGNQYVSPIVSTTTDLTPPVCSFISPPTIATNPLTVNATITETGSGLAGADLYVDSGSGIMDAFSSPYGCGVSSPTSFTCTSLTEGSFTFICGSVDVAGNVGPNASMNVDIDLTPPTGGITEPVGPWVNHVPFTVSWNYSDPVSNGISSGLASFNLQWDSGAGWTNATIGGSWSIPGTSISFGSGQYGEPTVLAEGQQLAFQARAWDVAGLTSPWSVSNTVTVDTVAPFATFNVTDQSGQLIQPGLIGVTQVRINSNATDPVPVSGPASGLRNHTVWIQTTHNGVVVQHFSCGAQEFCITGLVDIQGADEVIFWIEAIDVAGNVYRSPAFTLASHPLANFVNHDVLLYTGSRFMMDVQIRNLQPIPLTYLEVNLTGYALAGFVSGEGDFAGFSITPDGRGIAVTNMQSGGRGMLHIEVAGSNPGTANGLDFSAVGRAAQTTATDGDHAIISVIFPPIFDAWTDWAVVLLLGSVVILYALRR